MKCRCWWCHFLKIYKHNRTQHGVAVFYSLLHFNTFYVKYLLMGGQRCLGSSALSSMARDGFHGKFNYKSRFIYLSLTLFRHTWPGMIPCWVAYVLRDNNFNPSKKQQQQNLNLNLSGIRFGEPIKFCPKLLFDFFKTFICYFFPQKRKMFMFFPNNWSKLNA